MSTQSLTAALADPGRRDALRRTALLDSDAEEAFDRLTRVVTAVLGVPVALVSLVDADRQFFKSCVGLPEPWATARGTPLSHSFCQHVVGTGEPLVVRDAREHPEVRDNLAIRDLGVIAYAGIPLVTGDGHVLGSFCAIDSSPREWTEREVGILRDLAAAAATEIALRAEVVERRLAEAEREDAWRREREAREEAERARRRAERASAQRDEVLAIVAHDLRNPLMAISAATAVLLTESVADDVRRRQLGVIGRAGDGMRRLVNDLLDAAAFEAGRLALDRRPLAVGALVGAAFDLFEPQAAERQVRLERDLGDDAEATVCADEGRLLQAVGNLLANALQHTPAGGRVRLEARAEATRVVVSVADTGPGVAPEDLPHVFDAYWQAERSRRGNVGLGLSITRTLVEAHGGRVWAESAPGEGSRFSVALPLLRRGGPPA
jgi:hypothetical protein